MRILVKVLVIAMFLVFNFQCVTKASEGKEQKIFGVGASVVLLEDMSRAVETKGAKENEGAVYTPDAIKGGADTRLDVMLKGKGTVFLRLDESDARGTFIKDTKSQPVVLTPQWKMYHLAAKLGARTAQLDSLVLTNSKQQAKFFLKKLSVTQR